MQVVIRSRRYEMRSRTIGYWALAALGVAVLLFLLGGLFIGGWNRSMMPGMMWWSGQFGWPITALMMFSMVLFWVAIILGVIWLVRWIMEQSNRGRSGDGDPLEIIRRRYARGEINREEYERLREDLQPKS